VGDDEVVLASSSRSTSTAATRLSAVLFPACAPDLNPAGNVWSRAERTPANLATLVVDALEKLVRNRIERLEHRPTSCTSLSPRPAWPSTRNRHDVKAPVQ